MITIRKEQPADIDAIHQLNLSAFEDGKQTIGNVTNSTMSNYRSNALWQMT